MKNPDFAICETFDFEDPETDWNVLDLLAVRSLENVEIFRIILDKIENEES